MNLWDYILALNKATTAQPSGQGLAPRTGEGAAPTTGAEEPKPSAWKLFVGDLLNLAQTKWAPAGWVPFKLT